MSSSSFEKRITTLYQEMVKRNNEQCIMEEVKNNNQQALVNYDSLIDYINESVHLLRSEYNIKNLRAVDKIALNNVIQFKSNVIARKTVVEKRLNQQEKYKIHGTNRDQISSYTSFMSAFKPKSKPIQSASSSNGQTSGTDFKVPTLPQQQQQPQQFTNGFQNEVPVRKSLDLPRARKNQEFASRARSKSPSHGSRRERPKSIDLTINQAALLAWDAKQKSGTVSPRATSPPPQSKITKNNSSQNISKRKYDYVQPTINTQINLTPVGYNKMKSPTLGASSSRKASPKTNNVPRDENERPVLASANGSTKGLGIQANGKSYSDPRIKEVMNNLQGVDRQACDQILDEILITDEKLTWDDLAGLAIAKKSLKETVVYPFLRPDLFKGLREPISGMLLFGPPGTGKTMIAKTVANESNSTFFSISASSLLSKYLGESEKLIRALFYLAKKLSPSIIFFDEIDSLLTARSDNENESSRRVKTEFLIQWSSLSSATARDSSNENRVLVLAATNLPWAIDEAARRRFTRRLYIPLPEFETRLTQLHKLFQFANHSLSETDFIIIANLTEGYSNSDITSLAKEAAMEPIRDCGDNLMNINYNEVRGVELKDFERAMASIKKSVGKETLARFEQWASSFGSMGA